MVGINGFSGLDAFSDLRVGGANGTPVLMVHLHGRAFSPEVQGIDAKKVTSIIVDPLVSLTSQLLQLENLANLGLAQNVAYIDWANHVVLASEELAEQLMQNPQRLKGFKLKTLTKEEAEQLLEEETDLLTAMAKSLAKEEEANAPETEARSRALIQRDVRPLKDDARGSIYQSEVELLVHQMLQGPLLALSQQLDQRLAKIIWQKVTDQIAIEAEKSTIRAKEDRIEDARVEAERIREEVLSEVAQLYSILELRDDAGQVIGFATSDSSDFGSQARVTISA